MGARRLVVYGNYAYVISSNEGLIVFDISNKSFPEEIARYATSGDAREIAFSTDGAYVFIVNDSMRFEVVDVTFPAYPVTAGINELDAYPACVTVTDRHALFGYNDGLKIVNLYSMWEKVSSITISGSANPVVTEDNIYAFIVAGDIKLISLLDIANPFVALNSAIVGGGAIEHTSVNGDYIYVADNDFAFFASNISNPLNPGEAGASINIYDVYDVAFDTDYAYIADGNDGLLIIDISNPLAMSISGSYDPFGIVNDSSIEVTGNYAYVTTTDTSPVVQQLDIIDIQKVLASDPDPVIKTINTTDEPHDLAVSGNYAFIAEGDYGIEVIDTSKDPGTEIVGHYDTDGSAVNLALSGDLLYVADSANGLVLLDVSDPSSPVKLGTKSTNSDALSVLINGDYVFVSLSSGEFLITEKAVAKYTDMYADSQQVVQSKSIINENITSARIIADSSIPNDRSSIIYNLSNDGTHWYPVSNGIRFEFPDTPAGELYWRVYLMSNTKFASPVVNDIQVHYWTN